jgi:hypothetical protein
VRREEKSQGRKYALASAGAQLRNTPPGSPAVAFRQIVRALDLLFLLYYSVTHRGRWVVEARPGCGSGFVPKRHHAHKILLSPFLSRTLHTVVALSLLDTNLLRFVAQLSLSWYVYGGLKTSFSGRSDVSAGVSRICFVPERKKDFFLSWP